MQKPEAMPKPKGEVGQAQPLDQAYEPEQEQEQ
jgi:hypothetical protein